MFDPVKSVARRVVAAAIRFSKRDFLAVFNYHQVSPTLNPKYHLPQTWTELGYFEKQLLQIKSRFNVVRLPDAMEQLHSGTLRGACAALTFDDGDICLERYVTPLLAKHRVPATYFINTGYWGNRRTYWVYLMGYLANNELESTRKLLSEELRSEFRVLRNTTDKIRYRELRDLIECHADAVDPFDQLFVSKDYLASLDPELFSIALHGHEHQRFSMMPESWQRENIEKNIEQLYDLPGYFPIFGIPFGRPHDWDSTVIKLCEEKGLAIAFANGGVNFPKAQFCERMPADGGKALGIYRREIVGW
jgi:peptidoglycan/xylan/chitin deacetylase (PgdA/CDA1 family)